MPTIKKIILLFKNNLKILLVILLVLIKFIFDLIIIFVIYPIINIINDEIREIILIVFKTSNLLRIVINNNIIKTNITRYKILTNFLLIKLREYHR